MESCAQCNRPIPDADKAIYDGALEKWFCSHVCLGLYRMGLSDGVPV